MGKYGTTSDKLEAGEIIILGPPGAGKTFLSGTASKYWPKELGQHVVLKDMLYLPWDSGGLDGFKEYGITAPAINVRGMVKNEGLQKAIKLIPKEIEDAMTSETRYIVIDTVSTLDSYLRAFWEEKFMDKSAKQQLWGNVFANHAYLFDKLQQIDAVRIHIAHGKAAALMNETGETDYQKGVAKSRSADPGLVKLALTGQAESLYTRAASLQMVVVNKKDPATKAVKRVLLPSGDATFEGKNRWQRSLSDKEPADLSVVFKKIKLEE